MVAGMTTRVLVLGAGFGGLELSTMLSEALGDDVDVTLIDKSDAFVFGFSKLDVMFGRATPEAVRLPYSDIAKPGVRFLRETITAIDPESATRDDRRRRPRGRRPGGGARRRLRHGRHAGARRGRQRVLLRGRRRAAARGASHVLAGPSDRRRLRRAVQVPAGAERGGAAAARLSLRARRPRRLRDHLRDAAAEPGPALARHLRRRCSPPSPSAGSRSSPDVGSARSTRRAASPCSTTAASCPTTSSSASPSTAPRTWSWRAA